MFILGPGSEMVTKVLGAQVAAIVLLAVLIRLFA